ncbi:MAG: HAMP domain-containing histidine kinase [Methanoregula sp.]|jgi:signal transduction histidine kinase|nr:HAMP domain-containing histidine kinase [Methanoregula sp.]
MNDKPSLKNCEIQGFWWRILSEPHPIKLTLLVIAGLVLEFYVHYYLGISVVYTHFYYLIIVIAGLWYGRKAVWIAIFFGGLHITVTDLITGVISHDVLVRALMFCIVAFVVGTVAEQLRCYQTRLVDQNRELLVLNEDLNEANEHLEMSQKSFETANRKLNLLSGITRHDIRNQLTGLLGYLELIKMKIHDPEVIALLEKEERVAGHIVRQIEFTKNYEELGVNAPIWQDVAMSVNALKSSRPPGIMNITTKLDGLEVYADPLFEKVHENLIDNSIRHGERVKNISFTYIPYSSNAIAMVYQDDGTGIHDVDKEKIFEKGFGKNTGLGLFLTREILAITGITIRERGTYGKGVRFEILIPQGKYRFPEQP